MALRWVRSECIDAGDDVVVVFHERVRMRGSETNLEREWVQVWTIRDGRAVKLRAFRTRLEGLKAVGRAH